MSDKPVFFDATGRRAAGASIVGWTAAVVSLILGAAFVYSLLTNVSVATRFKLPGHLTAITIPDLEKRAQAPALVRSAARLGAEARARRAELAQLRRTRNERGLKSRTLASILKPQPNRPLSIAFYPNWEQSAYPALQYALPKLDWLVPTWLALQGPDLGLKSALDTRLLTDLRAKRPNLAILPVVQNATMGKWDGAGLAALLADPVRSEALRTQLVNFVATNKLQGLTVDFEEVPAGAHPDLEKFLKALSDAFVPRGLDRRDGRAVRRRGLALPGLRAARRLHAADGL